MCPAVEPRSGAARVDARTGTQMFAEIEQHVHQRLAHFSGCMEGARVVAMAPDWTATVPGAIYCAGGADGETLQTAAQRGCGVGFDDEVQVVRLRGELSNPKRVTAGLGDRLYESGEHGVTAERWHIGSRAHGDVDGMAPAMLGTGCVGRSRANP